VTHNKNYSMTAKFIVMYYPLLPLFTISPSSNCDFFPVSSSSFNCSSLIFHEVSDVLVILCIIPICILLVQLN